MIPSPFHGIFSAPIEPDAGSSGGSQIIAQHEKQMHHVRSEHSARVAPSASGMSGSRAQSRGAASATGGQVALDIFEYDNYYIIKAPMAGVKLADVDIEITDNVITIRGIRRQTDTIPQDQYYLQECFWGEFSRSVTLPCQIDPRKVKATFNKDCVLKILVPKEEKVKIVKISEG